MLLGGSIVRKLVVALLIMLALILGAQAQSPVIVRITDPRGDDWGGGALTYPDHQVYVPGLFDLQLFEVATDDEYIIFDFQFATLTNPFQAPEGYFHQRLEVYIRTGAQSGFGDMKVGAHQLKTSPDGSWDVRLSVAPFGESRLYAQGRVFTEEVSSLSLPESQTIRVQVKKNILPNPSPAWGYYVLVGSFDGLAVDFWRDLGEGPWEIGGEGFPIFDLLAPRWGSRSQENQLSKGVLYPISGGQTRSIWWLVGVLGLAVMAAGFYMWRWRRGRT